MAGVANSAKLSARLAVRHATPRVARRAFRVSSRDQAASNFTMPALSPTMTEGNISSWRVKEGDSYSAGDVLLEIETDKATMDVEAQDDGVMVKIVQPDGSKGVKVGHRIGVTAEPGDDVNSIEIPKDEAEASSGKPARQDRPSPQEEIAGGLDTTESSPSASEAPPSSKPNADASAGGAADTASATQKKSAHGGRARKQNYPLYPSVEHLLRENGLSKEDAAKMTASGPGGRLLKGDVLAYLGHISKDYPAQATARFEKLSHLDLSNIQLAKPAPKPETKEPAKPIEPELPKETEIAVSISLSAAITTQKRVQDTLGIFLPLSTFIARASELANEQLPLGKSRKPSADDLFNSVMGLDKVAKSSRGHYVPQVTGLSPMPPAGASQAKARKQADIIDLLTPKKAAKKTSSRALAGAMGIAMGQNLFSVTAKLGDERRATQYLERMKMALEKEPGRLVL